MTRLPVNIRTLFAAPLAILSMACFSRAADTIAAAPGAADWLVDPAPYKADIHAGQGGSALVLDNGLARRVIKLAPNAATVELQCESSGEQLLRAVSPEARITIDGVEYEIGGFEVQSPKNNQASKTADVSYDRPWTYHLASWTEEPLLPRMAWKKHVEWMGRDLPWPPPGKHVVMHYVPPAAESQTHGGPILFHEEFGKTGGLMPGWNIHTSPSLESATFNNEGKTGEIMALPNTCVYAEHEWPAGAASVEATVDVGDDTVSSSWGPGIAIVAKDGSITSFVIRPNSSTYEVNGDEIGGIQFDRAKPVTLCIKVSRGEMFIQASQEKGPIQHIFVGNYDKIPAAIRIGKIGKGGNGADFDSGKGTDAIHCHIRSLTLHGPEASGASASRTDLPAVDIHYEIYDGIPLFSKWLVVRNTTGKTVRVNKFEADELRLSGTEAGGGHNQNQVGKQEDPDIYVETDMAFGSRMIAALDNHAVKLSSDPGYQTPANTPTLLSVAPRAYKLPGDPVMGPDQDLAPGAAFESFRCFELLLDSGERERRTLAQRKMYRVIAPWTQENPIFFHTTKADPDSVRKSIAQAHDTGFELVMMSFFSGFNFENTDPKYIETYKTLSNEGRKVGVWLAGYSLLASRGAATPHDNMTGPVTFGVMPCLGSVWGQQYLAKLGHFIMEAGLGLENDGSYPGDMCSAEDHPGHHGLEDSVWVNWRAITDLYKLCRAQGVYLGVPDWYQLSGANKCAMGYNEKSWSQPRAKQVLIERTDIFDGTWTKTPSMGWMFVPLIEYEGGGAAATLEPLDEHLPDLDQRFADLLGAGVQACYRGSRLYDTDRTRALEQKWVAFYKTHREVLDEDIIHLQRPSGTDWDGILHVNPQGKEKAMAFFYNPLAEDIERKIRVPLHYAGLSGRATVTGENSTPEVVTLDEGQVATLDIKIPAGGYSWRIFIPTN